MRRREIKGEAMKETIYHIHQNYETREVVRFYICGTTLPDKTYHINRPQSRIYCIEYVEQGKGIVHINSDTFFPCAGDSYFLHIGKDHNYYSNAQDPWKKHFINLSGKLVDSLVDSYGLSDVSFFSGLNLEKELKSIIEIVKKGKESTIKTDYTADLIAIVSSIFFKMYTHKRNAEGAHNIGAVMKDFLNKQCTEEFNIDLLCKHIARSKSQTIKMFKQYFGITPYQYFLDKKIGLAKKLLENTNLSIADIAKRLCFSSQFSFSNTFKKKTNMSPTTYRKWTKGEYK